MIVVDASALVNVLTVPTEFVALRGRLDGAGSLHAPHLLDTEVQAAFRGLVAGGRLSPAGARIALADLRDLTVLRYPAFPLADRVWELRSSLTSYDATYVALAERLECSLVTCDRKLARGIRGAHVEIY